MKKLIAFCLIIFQCVVVLSQEIFTSPDGKKRVIIGKNVDGSYQVIVNSLRHNNYQKIVKNKIYFYTDSFKVVYLAKCYDGYCMVVDGKEQQHFKEINNNTIIFSPDKSNYAYAALKDTKWLYIINGVEQPQYENVSIGFTFSPNSEHWAYAASKDNKWFYIIDGVEQPHYDEISLYVSTIYGITFSPDSKHWAYAARNDKKWFYIIDSVEQPHYNQVFEINLIYSQDNLHWNYGAKKDGRMIYIIDGKETLADNIKYTTSNYHEFSSASKFFIKTGYGLSKFSSAAFYTSIGSGLLYLATKEKLFSDGFSTLLGLSVISSLTGPLSSCIGASISDLQIRDFNYWGLYRQYFLLYTIFGVAIPLVLIETNLSYAIPLGSTIACNLLFLSGLNHIPKIIYRQFLFHNKINISFNPIINHNNKLVPQLTLKWTLD